MDVNVSIKTTQYDNDGNRDFMDIKYLGKMYYKNNDTYIVYKEKENDITNTIKISGNQINIKRFGDSSSNMELEKGKKNITRYRIPQGVFLIETYTNDLNINLIDDKRMSINIDYNIKIGDMFEGRNKIEIYIENK